MPESSEPLSSEDSPLDAGLEPLDALQHVCGAARAATAAAIGATVVAARGAEAGAANAASLRRTSSSACISLAKSAAVKAHLSALGLTGVVFEMKKLQVPEAEPMGTARRMPLATGTTGTPLQNGALGGILIGGGMLFRLPERELLDADVVPLALDEATTATGRVGDTVIGDEFPLEPEIELGAAVVDETVRFSRGPRSVCAGLARDADAAALLAEEVEVGAATGFGTAKTGTGATGATTGTTGCCTGGWGVTARGALGVRRGLSESCRRRRIISAETFHKGERARDGRAGDNGGLVLPLVEEVVDWAGGGRYDIRFEGNDELLDRRFPRGSTSVSIFVLAFARLSLLR